MSTKSESADEEKIQLLLVDVEPDSPESPLLWPFRKRIAHTIAYGLTTFCAQFSASVLAPAVPQISTEFKVSVEVSVLVMSIYVIGNSLGPMLFAPLSEIYGRKIGIMVPFMISCVFQMLVACIDSVAAAVVLRFIAGVFAAAPIVCSGAAMTDMWPPQHRAAALVLYAIFIVMGPSFSPIFGALLVDTGTYGWRWCCWLGGIMGFIVGFLNFCFLDESYRPVLASRKARHIRITTGNWAAHSPHDELSLTWGEFIKVHCARPILMFMTPIIFMMAIFASYAYGLMFLVISSVGDNFETVKGFTGVYKFLPLIAVFLGYCTGGFCNVMNSRNYARLYKKNANYQCPETRLWAMMLLSWSLAAGCFIYGWTLRANIHWIVPVIGIYLIGVGIAVTFQGAINYIVDCFPRYSASVIASNTVLRSIFGGVFPLFANKLYSSLGVHWGSSLLGFLSLVVVPVSFLLYFFGPKARKFNPYAKLIS